MSVLTLEYPEAIAELAVDFDSGDLGPSVLRANAMVPWQNEGQQYASCQTSHAKSIFEIDTPRGKAYTGMLKHFFKCPTAGTSKGSDLLTEPLFPVILNARVTASGVVLLNQQECLEIGAFEAVMRAR